MNEKYLKYGANLVFLFLFLGFSLGPLIQCMNGDVVYNLVSTYDPEPDFPSITFCPTQDINPLMNLKVRKLMIDFNLTDQSVSGHRITGALMRQDNLSEIIKHYSYGIDDSFEDDESSDFV